MRNKKFLLAAGVVTLLLLLGLGVMLFLSGNNTQETPVEDQFPTAGDAPVGQEGEEEPRKQSFWLEGAEEGGVLPVLRAISNKPVVGATVLVQSETGYQEFEYVRYVERSSGHIFDAALTRNEEPVVRSGETMLRIGRVYWSPNGTTTLLQRLDASGTEIYSYVGSFVMSNASTTLTTPPEGQKFTGRHLEYGDVLTAAISPDARSIFYIVRTETGSVGYLESVVLGTRTPVWNSPLRNLTAVWTTGDSVLVYTNPSSVAPGFAWLLNVRTGAKNLVLGGELALAARMSPSGTKILYSLQENEGGITSLRVLDIASGDVSYIPSGVASIVEKCAWDSVRDTVVYCAVPRNLGTKDYLEDWRYGLLASNDVLWQVHIDTGEARQVLDPVEVTTNPFDIIDLQVSPFGDYLVFRTKQDELLWSAQVPVELLPSSEPDPTATTTPVL